MPWPSEDVIRQGALGHLQVMLEQGVDPNSITAGVGEDAKDGTKDEAVSIENPADTAAYGGVSDKAKSESKSRPLGQQAEMREEKPKVFGGLNLYDPDEEG